MALPEVYLYELRESIHCLFLGGFTTSSGLSVVPADASIRIRRVHTDDVASVPQSLSGMQSPTEVQRFLKQAVGLYDFECAINESTILSTHDDCECHFQFEEIDSCKTVVSHVSPFSGAGQLWDILMARAGQYVVIDSGGTVHDFANFDDYLAASDGLDARGSKPPE